MRALTQRHCLDMGARLQEDLGRPNLKRWHLGWRGDEWCSITMEQYDMQSKQHFMQKEQHMRKSDWRGVRLEESTVSKRPVMSKGATNAYQAPQHTRWYTQYQQHSSERNSQKPCPPVVYFPDATSSETRCQQRDQYSGCLDGAIHDEAMGRATSYMRVFSPKGSECEPPIPNEQLLSLSPEWMDARLKSHMGMQLGTGQPSQTRGAPLSLLCWQFWPTVARGMEWSPGPPSTSSKFWTQFWHRAQ